MKYLIYGALLGLFFSGCATWQGIKQDTSDAANWTKRKVNDGAQWVEEKNTIGFAPIYKRGSQ